MAANHVFIIGISVSCETLNFSFIAPPSATIELTPEMNALKNQLLFDVQQAIRREVTRAVNRTTAMMEQRFDAKIMQIFDDIFRAQNEDELGMWL